jgi:nucleoside-diphosphate-sugar epimerase
MRTLVTGFAGRIGRCLTKELLRRGHEVVGLDVREGLSPEKGLRQFHFPLSDHNALDDALDKVDVVVHLAAVMSWADSDAFKLFEANVDGTFHLLQAARKANLQRFVFASSGEVYPERCPIFLPIDEHHPVYPNSYYGMTKHLGEQMVWFFSHKFGIPAVVLRFAHTQDAAELLDPDSFFSGPRFFLRSRIRRERELRNSDALAVLEPLDDGTEKLLLSQGEDGTPYRMGICETRDLVQGILLAMESDKAINETIGIGPDEAASFAEIIPVMAKATGLSIAEARLPGPAVNYFVSNAKARELLGFKPNWSMNAMLEEAARRRSRL